MPDAFRNMNEISLSDPSNAIEVAVVGGGPCGLMAALLLARAGVRVVVFEAQDELSQHPKAMGLNHRTCEIFRQIGILEKIREGRLDLDGRSLVIWAKTLVGEELGRTALGGRNSPLTPCESLHCPQTWTERTLLEAVEAEELAEVRFGVRVADVACGDGEVRLSLSNGSEIDAAWVIAADGAGSGIRTGLGIEADGPGEMGHFVNVFFRAPLGDALTARKSVLYNVVSETVQEFFVAVDGGDHWLMHHFLQPGESPADFTDAIWTERIREGSGILNLPVEVLGASPWVMSPKVARTWRQKRVFLIGDAAARLSPSGGLGLNTGLQGTHNLAWKLAAVISGRAAASLLDTYEVERRPSALRVMGNTNKNAEEIFSVVMAAVEGNWETARALIARSRRAGSGLGQDLGLSYDAGAFVSDGSKPNEVADPVNDYAAEARPGSRAPHVELADPEGGSILDLFGHDFVAILGRSADSWKADGLRVCQNGIDFDAPEFECKYGISNNGAVLVRPDGFVAARFPDQRVDGQSSLADLIDQLLRQ